jgi:hypothetical protein
MLRPWAGRMQGGMCAAALAVLVASQTAALGQDQCVGDCDGNGTVAISELVLAVNIALNGSTAGTCPAAECNQSAEGVTIDCLVAAVKNGLEGCSPIPTTAGIVFNGENNRLHAYQPGPGFPKQTVIPAMRMRRAASGAISTDRSASRAARRVSCA